MWGGVLSVYTGESDEHLGLQTLYLLYPVRRTHHLPTDVLDYNVRKFFFQASFSVQTRDREELPASQPSGDLTVYQRALSKLAEVCYRN